MKEKIKKITTLIPLLLLYFYRVNISPRFPNSCRFTPSCSQYAIEAYKKYGLFKGSILTIKRLLKCHPRGECGYDPVP